MQAVVGWQEGSLAKRIMSTTATCDRRATRLVSMQPYFFPYLGYFSLMAVADRWILFDTAQHIRKGWVNRNRVLSRGGGWKYINLPVHKCPVATAIKDVRIRNEEDWPGEILRNLDYYRERRAPHYAVVLEFLRAAFAEREEGLADFLATLLRKTCRFIGLEVRIEPLSKMGLSLPPVACPADWGLRMAQATGANVYINAPGGRALYDAARFASAGIELLFLDPALPPYPQGRDGFIPGLSIIDALMWNSPDAVLGMVRQYNLSPS
jgi:hypothetical protein